MNIPNWKIDFLIIFFIKYNILVYFFLDKHTLNTGGYIFYMKNQKIPEHKKNCI